MIETFEHGKHPWRMINTILFEIAIYYELNKPKKWKKKQKIGKNREKTQECLNNIRIRFPTYENECYAKRTRILRTMSPSTK